MQTYPKQTAPLSNETLSVVIIERTKQPRECAEINAHDGVTEENTRRTSYTSTGGEYRVSRKKNR